jgi:hypothetical protein
MSAHTPGPWEVRKGYKKTEVRPCRPTEGYTLGFAPLAVVKADKRTVDQATLEANARLIAAAPELLKALQELVNVHSAGAANETIALDFWDHAKHSIAKATGEAT